MSLDALTECTECKGHSALRLWVQVYQSVELAQMGSQADGFISAMLPGPGLLKVEICVSCRTFRPILEYTKEEEAALQRYKELNDSKNRTAENMGKLFGLGSK
jgi:hypothetical protein